MVPYVKVLTTTLPFPHDNYVFVQNMLMNCVHLSCQVFISCQRKSGNVVSGFVLLILDISFSSTILYTVLLYHTCLKIFSWQEV